jgi:hypothetical protein
MARADIYGTDPTSMASRIAGDALGSPSPDTAGSEEGSKGNVPEAGEVVVTHNKGGKASSEGN